MGLMHPVMVLIALVATVVTGLDFIRSVEEDIKKAANDVEDRKR